jgi:hypothetical protein
MAGTVVAVFQDKMQAETAAEALLKAGITFADIALVNKHAGGEVGSPSTEGQMPEDNDEEFLSHAVREVRTHDVEEPMNRRAGILPLLYVGSFLGGVIGMMIVTISVYFPSMYKIIEAHPLLTILVGTVIGAAIGGMLAVQSAGDITPREAGSYHDHVQRGHTLVTVIASKARAATVEEILGQHGGQELSFHPRVIDSIQSVES